MKTPYWFTRITILAIVLIPVSFIYRIASGIVYRVRRRRAYTPRRMVICIGNILAGGVGKTPIVRQIATRFSMPVVMRGYKSGRATSNVGDEALMLSRAGLAVHTGDRRSNIMLLDRQLDDTPIIMDDGFQNPSVKKTISILVFDASIGVGNGLILPAGPMRQSRRAVRNADAVIIIRAAHGKQRRIKIPANIPVFYAENETISPYSADEKLYAFAGIGYPKKFFTALKNVVGCRKFADHYQYTDDDIKKIMRDATALGAKPITTEKDWVRLPAQYREQIKFAGLNTQIDEAFFDWLKERINDHNKQKD